MDPQQPVTSVRLREHSGLRLAAVNQRERSSVVL